MINLNIEVRWYGDRRRKVWIMADDLRDPVFAITLQGNGFVARNELEFINIEDPAVAVKQSRSGGWE